MACGGGAAQAAVVTMIGLAGLLNRRRRW
jgi:MYXO-CTERM domain-containing protein